MRHTNVCVIIVVVFVSCPGIKNLHRGVNMQIVVKLNLWTLIDILSRIVFIIAHRHA